MDLSSDLATTVVGSYPARPSKAALMDSYRSGCDPFLDSIGTAVEAQVDAGIQIVTDGQTRTDMIRLFASALRGFRIREKVSIVADIAYRKSITVHDQKRVKNMIPEGTALKGIITGPITLVMGADNVHYADTYDAVADTVSALRNEVKALEEVCDVIQVDEPYLSVEYPEYAGDIMKELLKDVKIPTALHVCGDVSDIAKELVNFDVDILDHEFVDNPSLYDVYGDIDHEKRMAVGIVTTRPELESEETISGRIRRAYDTFGPGCMLDPDCGLRMLTKAAADEKLKRMVAARDKFMEEIS